MVGLLMWLLSGDGGIQALLEREGRIVCPLSGREAQMREALLALRKMNSHIRLGYTGNS